MRLIARYESGFSGIDFGAGEAAPSGPTGAEAWPLDGHYGSADIIVTVAQASTAMTQADAYIQALARDFIAWARSGPPASDRALYAGFVAFAGGWASFLEANSDLNLVEGVLSTRSIRDTAHSYLDQAAQWRDRLVSTGAVVNTPSKPAPAGTGPQWQWPSLADVPWWVWALGAAGVALYFDLPRKLGLIKGEDGMRINFGVDQSRDWTLLDEEENQSVPPPQWNPPSGTPPAGDDTGGGSGTAVKVVGALLLVGFGWWFTRGTS